MEEEKRWVPYLMILPSIIVILLFIAYPILNAVELSFIDGETGEYTLSNYTYFFVDDIQRANMIYTLRIVLITVFISILVGYGLAIYLRFSDSKIAKLIGQLTLLPRFIPGLVAVQSVLVIIMDGGVVSRIAQWFDIQYNLGWMYSDKAIIFMNLWFNIPFATLIILASMSNVQDSFIESARDAGSKWGTIFSRIILPLTYKEAIVAGTFVYMSNIGSFTTPYIMGGTHPKMLGIVLFDQFNAYMEYERAAALSVIMFLLCIVAAAIYIWASMRQKVWEKG